MCFFLAFWQVARSEGKYVLVKARYSDQLSILVPELESLFAGPKHHLDPETLEFDSPL